MCAGCSNSLSWTDEYRDALNADTGETLLNRSSEDSLQDGTSSVNSEPSPKSISRKPYSHVEAAAAAAAEANDDADDDVREYVDDDIVDKVVNVVGVLLDGLVADEDTELLLLCTEDAVNVPLIETDEEFSETGVATGGLVDDVAGGRIVNRSLLFRGSSADCEERLRTELQLMERLESSSPYPESLSLVVVVFETGVTGVGDTGLAMIGNGVALPDCDSRNG